jgi:hypothetical protein
VPPIPFAAGPESRAAQAAGGSTVVRSHEDLVVTYRTACNLLFLSLALVSGLPAFGATTWTQPTPDELKMTSDPKAPNAPAVYLNRDEYVDIPGHFHRIYARIKILTPKGIDEYGDIEIPYEAGASNIRAVEGRTIHADGTVVPFAGKPNDKELVKSGGVRINAKVFSMPDVQVGCILEYRYELQYDDGMIFPPEFHLQEQIFVHEAHYHFIPFQLDPGSSSIVLVPDGHGHMMNATRLLYYPAFPPEAKFQDLPSGFDLVVKDVPPIPDEPYSPPLDSFSYRLIFYYSSNFTGQEFWTNEGKMWSKEVDRFAEPSDAIKQAVAQTVAPGDTDDQKLGKIYSAVMTLENTGFSREHSQEENRAEGVQLKTAADIWTQKRGSPNEITRLFIAMARAAGMKASAMIVTKRDRRMLNPSYLSWSQLTDEIAIVAVDGKDVYFDPGERYCEYGKLHWMHTQVLGFRQTDGGTQNQITPAADYKDTQVKRIANLQLGPDCKVDGTIKISMTGVEALRWRQRALRSDEDAAKRDFEEELQGQVPAGNRVKMDQFTNLTDSAQPLIAAVTVSGSMGTQTGKRVIVPGTFFEASAKSLFAAETRENPVDMHYPYAVQDTVKLTLAPGLIIASVPQNAQIPYPQNAQFVAKYSASGGIYQQVRLLAVGNTVFKKEDYPQLRDFFQKANAQDQQQVVLERSAMAAGAGDAGKSE